jgi:hypothetical protein
MTKRSFQIGAASVAPLAVPASRTTNALGATQRGGLAT